MREYFYFRDPYTLYSEIFNAKINCKEIYLSLQKLAVLQLLFILNSKLATMLVCTSTVFQPQVALFFFCGHILDSKSAFS